MWPFVDNDVDETIIAENWATAHHKYYHNKARSLLQALSDWTGEDGAVCRRIIRQYDVEAEDGKERSCCVVLPLIGKEG
jgi:hypothetical protein